MSEDATTLPKIMKAAVAIGFGEIDENIHVKEDWPVPELTSEDTLLIRVLACALAPGDLRVLSGKTDWIQLPKGGHPYIVGGDVSGIVVKCGAKAKDKFKEGDYVVSRFELPGPNGGLCEYRIVKTSLTEICPSSIDPIVSCGLTASAMSAKKMVQDYVKKENRILVIGGSGSVGSSILQYAKLAGAGYIVAVSTQKDLCLSLGADEVIDYRNQNWWEMEEYQEKPFHVVFDMAGGNNWEMGGYKNPKAVAKGGTYVAVLPGVRSEIELHGVLGLVSISFQWIWRTLSTKLNPSIPTWAAPQPLDDLKEGDLSGLLQDVVEGKLKPIVDPKSPFDFTTAGVRDAFHLQASCHAHGKSVVKIAELDTKQGEK